MDVSDRVQLLSRSDRVELVSASRAESRGQVRLLFSALGLTAGLRGKFKFNLTDFETRAVAAYVYGDALGDCFDLSKRGEWMFVATTLESQWDPPPRPDWSGVADRMSPYHGRQVSEGGARNAVGRAAKKIGCEPEQLWRVLYQGALDRLQTALEEKARGRLLRRIGKHGEEID